MVGAGFWADLFTEDAQLTVLGQTFAGRSEIARRIRDAAGGPVFRHMMSTIRIFPDDETHAQGESLLRFLCRRRPGIEIPTV